MSFVRFIAMLALLPLAAGCDKELLAGGQEVEVFATDQPPQQQASFSRSSTDAPGEGPLAQVVPQLFEGTVEFEVSVSLVHTSGAVASVTTAPVSGTLAIGGNQSVDLGRRKIDGGRYTVIRMAFNRVEATLTAGPGVIGTRVVEVDIGQQPFVVEHLVDLVVGVTPLETLQINLNTSTWVLLEQAGLVDPNHFAAAVQVRVVT